MAAVQAAIPVARLSETEGSSNAVGGLEISAAIVTSRTGAGLAPTAVCAADIPENVPVSEVIPKLSRPLPGTPVFPRTNPVAEFPPHHL